MGKILSVLARFFNGRGRVPLLLQWGGEGQRAPNLTSPHLSHFASLRGPLSSPAKEAGEDVSLKPSSTSFR
jgi:hypothetical protein